MKGYLILLPLALCLFVSTTLCQANGKLQIHFMDVGQGDGTVLISPQGEVVLFDNGVRNNCKKPVAYLKKIGVKAIDYHIASHYHDDHIGCTKEVLGSFPLKIEAIDRGFSYHTQTYKAYLNEVSSKRKQAEVGRKITLDAGSAPVVIEFVAVNGNIKANGDTLETKNENDRSLVAIVRFGSFDAMIGGDLSGENTASYRDIETQLAKSMKAVEVYKVHHHGSAHSSNVELLAKIKPLVGIISAGDKNTHGHPNKESLERLHERGIKTYWTSKGSGASPVDDFDFVSSNIVIEVASGSSEFTVKYNGSSTHKYSNFESEEADSGVMRYAWSQTSPYYHKIKCSYVAKIKSGNLRKSSIRPTRKTIHQGCPK